MPKPKGYAINIPRLYKWQALDNICFGYVNGLRAAAPSTSITEAIKIFLDAFELCEDTYCFDNAKAGYYRVLSSLVEIRDGFIDDVGDIIVK